MLTISELVGTKESGNTRTAIPERELLIATLDRAVLDYYGSDPVFIREACEWIFEESDPGIEFSFLWTCAYLELEPAELRKRIRQLTISQDVSQAHRWLRTKVQSREAGGAAVCGDSK